METKLVLISVVATVFATIVATSAQQHDNHEQHRVNVAVYYESLCPDSRKFFNQQLYPALQLANVSNYINLTLVPYGKATLQGDQFTCHHGPAECFGNKIQACALHHIDDGRRTEGLGYNKISAGFINCLMDKVVRMGDEATFPTKECAQLNRVNNLNIIENCANHTDGSNYLQNYGKLTDAVMSPLTSVPTIVFNKQFKQEDSTAAQTRFVKVLCQYIHGDKPSECNGASGLKMSVFFLLIASIFSRYFY